MWLKNYYHIAAGGKWPKGTTGGSEWGTNERPTTREADEGRDMTAIYLRHFIIIREVNKEMRLWK